MAGKINVVFASLLKPVDEPRMYHKLARSLAKTNKYSINIIGFESKNLPADPDITFFPLFKFKRLSPERALAPLKFFRKLLQLKPQLIVLSSPDFLLVSCLYKILFGVQIVYDVQENMYRNIIWSHHRPTLLRKLRASLLRMKEITTNRMIIHFILAEACYENECSFIHSHFTLLENKARRPLSLPVPKKAEQHEKLQLLYSGTIGESYGILDTIPLVDAIYAHHKNLEYAICGHCPNAELARQLNSLAQSRPWIRLLISPSPIPHQRILEELQKAHFSLVAYRLNPSSQDCRPSRIWEALAWKVPLILRQEHPWKAWVAQHEGGFAIAFLNPDTERLLEGLFKANYYTRPLPPDIYWESDEESWIKLVDELFQ